MLIYEIFDVKTNEIKKEKNRKQVKMKWTLIFYNVL
jgi:hypothetical protein